MKNEIHALLVEMMAGDEHFVMATLVRNSCLVSSMIFNCEAWYGLTLKQVKILEESSWLPFKNTHTFDVHRAWVASHKVYHPIKETKLSQIYFRSKGNTFSKASF